MTKTLSFFIFGPAVGYIVTVLVFIIENKPIL